MCITPIEQLVYGICLLFESSRVVGEIVIILHVEWGVAVVVVVHAYDPSLFLAFPVEAARPSADASAGVWRVGVALAAYEEHLAAHVAQCEVAAERYEKVFSRRHARAAI